MSHVFLLFGASRGIGAACARQLFARGAQVVLTARDADQLEQARQYAGPSATAHTCDIGSADNVQAVVDSVRDTYGQIDSVINFAAQTGPLNRPVWGVKPSEWEDTQRLNVSGPYNIIRSCMPVMQEKGKGTFLFASSPFGDNITAGMGIYGATRAGANSLVRQLAAELDGSNIGAALVYPGITDTEGLEDFRQARGGGAMGAQVASPEEMAKLFVWSAMQTPWDINGRVLAWADPRVRSAVEALR